MEKQNNKCPFCERKVVATSKAVQCHLCDRWIHIQCGDIDKELYQHLMRSSSSVISFQCVPCQKMMNDIRINAGLPPLEKPGKEEQPKVTTCNQRKTPIATDTPVKQLVDIDQPIEHSKSALGEHKTYADVVSESPGKLNEDPPKASCMVKQKKRERVNKAIPKLEEVVEKVKQLEKMVKENTLSSNGKPKSGVPSRDRCLIILNAPESYKETAAERMQDDQVFLQRMVSLLFEKQDEDGINVITAFRLGRKPDEGAKPRPLKVVLQDEEECRRVLRRTFRLKGESFFVVRDLSPEDRIRMREAVKALKTRRSNGENDLHIVDFQVVQKRPRVVWRPVLIKPVRMD